MIIKFIFKLWLALSLGHFLSSMKDGLYRIVRNFRGTLFLRILQGNLLSWKYNREYSNLINFLWKFRSLSASISWKFKHKYPILVPWKIRTIRYGFHKTINFCVVPNWPNGAIIKPLEFIYIVVECVKIYQPGVLTTKLNCNIPVPKLKYWICKLKAVSHGSSQLCSYITVKYHTLKY